MYRHELLLRQVWVPCFAETPMELVWTGSMYLLKLDLR